MADNIQGFIKELAFEEALTHHLLDHGWNEVIKNPTEEQLVQNWADIIYGNTCHVLLPGKITSSQNKVSLRLTADVKTKRTRTWILLIPCLWS